MQEERNEQRSTLPHVRSRPPRNPIVDNPYFARREIRDAKHHFRQWQTIGLAVIGAMLAIYGIWFSGYFSVSEIVITGNENLSNERIATHIRKQLETPWLWIFPQNNLLFLRSGQLHGEINGEFLLKQLTVVKSFPHTLRIAVEERLPGLLLTAKGEQWVIDTDGVILGHPQELPPGIYPLVTFDREPEASFTSRTQAIRPDIATMILRVFEDLPDDQQLHPTDAQILLTECVEDEPIPEEEKKISDQKGTEESDEISPSLSNTNATITNQNINTTVLPEPTITLEQIEEEKLQEELLRCKSQNLSRDVAIRMSEGYTVLFTTFLSLEEQLRHLQTFLESDVAASSASISSIDLRYGNKIFYRP